jgi:hypothetical protein
MDDADTKIYGIANAADLTALSVDVKDAFIGSVVAAEQLDQRAFAGAVFAGQGNNLTSVKVQTHPI